MSGIILAPMDKSEFSAYMLDNIRRYAAENVRAGRWAEEESVQMAEKSINDILPEGMDTKGNFFFDPKIPVSGEKIGVVWLSVLDQTKLRSVFIYDILIFEGFRGKGLGTETLKEIEAWAKGIEATSIWLHAFWSNQRSIALYRRMGYAESDLTMSKTIG